MKDKRSLHLKVQELCNCYAMTDPLKEMSIVKHDKDEDEAGLKWLALAALHGINAHAKKISFARSKDGTAKVTAEYRKSELPSPGPDVGDKIIGAAPSLCSQKAGLLSIVPPYQSHCIYHLSKRI